MSGEQTKAPKCKICGSPHWSWQPHVFSVRDETQIITPEAHLVTKSVTKFEPVTKMVTKRNKRGRVSLGDEPMTPAERMRRMRAIKADLQKQGLVK